MAKSAANLARISHTGHGLRRFKKPTGQEPRAERCGTSGKRGDTPCRLLQPALRVAFRRASAASGGSTVCLYTLFSARRRICRAERATQAMSSVRNAGLPLAKRQPRLLKSGNGEWPARYDRGPARRSGLSHRRPDRLSDRQSAGRGLHAVRRISWRAPAQARLRREICARRRHARRLRPLPAHQRGSPPRGPLTGSDRAFQRPYRCGRARPGLDGRSLRRPGARRPGLWPRRLRHEGRPRRGNHRGRDLHRSAIPTSPARSRYRARSTRNPADSAASPISRARAVSRSPASIMSSSRSP